jgi:hypothetical protein
VNGSEDLQELESKNMNEVDITGTFKIILILLSIASNKP